MPNQLFLFDIVNKTSDSNKPGEENADAVISSGLVEANKEIVDIDFEATATVVVHNSADTIDRFAAIQQEQEDKIANMLLLPNKKRGRKSFKDMDTESILVEVPEDDVLFQKQYYPTRTVAEWFGITVSQLRMWEAEFTILKPKKNAKGDRFFRPEDVKNLKLIYHLIRKRKFTVQGAKQYLNENRKNLQETMQLVESLNKFKQFLLELKAISQ